MKVLGVMSGTSLDGIDFALCDFLFKKNEYSFKLVKTQTINYSNFWIENLKIAQDFKALDFILLHKKYGEFIGKQANIFLKNTEKPEIIASHGHTIFHQPEKKLTFQLGDGAFIAAQTEITTVSDFRNLDTALAGQGAPLVPLGDKFLFPEYDYCINLGGFANISFDDLHGERKAFDICPVNFVINYFSQKLGLEFDKNGEIAEKGKFNNELFDKLNSIQYYIKKHPKSLAREFVEKEVYPIINDFALNIPDILRTFYSHIVFQISKTIDTDPFKKILITGGGAKNKFLINLLKNEIKAKIIIPEKDIIDFKEAIIFAFLGFLRVSKNKNILKSVTGSNFDNYGGIINLI